MPGTRERSSDVRPTARLPTRSRPVVLGTLSVRPDPTAEQMAIDSCLEAAVPLIIANVVFVPPYPQTVLLAGVEAAVLPHEEDLYAVRETADRAAALGIPVRHLRVATRHQVTALLEVVRENDAGLLVFGPDLTRIGARRFRRAARRLRRDAGCLVWVAPDG